MISAEKIRDQLISHGVTHVVGLPDNLFRALFELLDAEPSIEVILVSREGEAFAIAAGLQVGGKTPVVLIQNTGLLESGDAFRGTSWRMEIPQVILLSFRGYATLASKSGRKDSVAEFTVPTLKAWNIPYEIMNTDEDLDALSRAFQKAQSTSLPAAVAIVEDTR